MCSDTWTESQEDCFWMKRKNWGNIHTRISSVAELQDGTDCISSVAELQDGTDCISSFEASF